MSLLKSLIYGMLLVGMIGFVACDDEEDEPTPSPVQISFANSVTEGVRGETVTVLVDLSADGIQRLTVSVDGGPEEEIPVNSGANAQQVSYEYDIPGTATLNTTYTLEFTLTDQNNASSSQTVTITTAKAIETPSTYTFERDGSSTVSFSGQTDRLNMVAEIKSKLLAEGDRGNMVTEQALSDAFENTNNNGNGLFSFTSDRQLRDKTFQPDLDNQLFETLFEELAAASVLASGGTMADDGVAGLITRENSGNTILLDENGREFTQLIEKGLMGAVFFNQIYNVYFTPVRIGPSVENVEVRAGQNYTDMEHHWDEAFGYFHPPLDFTSPWPQDRRGELRFWSNYSDVVDRVASSSMGFEINKTIMDAFIEGRTAIVNNDPDTRDAQRDILYEHLELVAAGTAIHYINSSLRFLNEGKPGELFHVMSEVWAFTNALKYSPRRRITLEEIDEINGTDLGANGNFWNVTAEGLNKAKSTLVLIYEEFDPIKDEL